MERKDDDYTDKGCKLISSAFNRNIAVIPVLSTQRVKGVGVQNKLMSPRQPAGLDIQLIMLLL